MCISQSCARYCKTILAVYLFGKADVEVLKRKDSGLAEMEWLFGRQRLQDDPSLDIFDAAERFSEAVQSLQENVERISQDGEIPSYWTNETYMRFLRAHKMNVSKATEVISWHLRYRQATALDTAKPFAFPELESYLDLYPCISFHIDLAYSACTWELIH